MYGISDYWEANEEEFNVQSVLKDEYEDVSKFDYLQDVEEFKSLDYCPSCAIIPCICDEVYDE